MPSIAENVHTAACRVTARIHGVKLTIRRGDKAIVIDGAIPGETEWEAVSVSDIVDNHFVTRDFVVPVDEYDFGDGPVTPDQADHYEIDGPHGVETYRLNAPKPERPWRYTPPSHRSHYRLHTTLEATTK